MERAAIPRIQVDPPIANVTGGIDVTSTFSLAVWNDGAVEAVLSVAEPQLLAADGTLVSDSISVVPNGSIPTLTARRSVSLSLDVTPDQAVSSGTLVLVATTEPASWPEVVQIEVPIDVAADWDRDGADHPAAGGDDCDDQDPSIGPSAREIWYDGVDQDCDGNDLDADEDGFDVSEDCDDLDETAFPGGNEVWYDGVDQDCDGNDSDQDLDGHDATATGGADCDDTNADVGPMAPDGGLVGLDDDCDGLIDEDDVVEGVVVVTEVMRSSSAGVTGAWFELANTSDRLWDLSGWSVETDLSSGTIQVEGAESPALAPGSVIVVCADPLAAAGLDIPCGASLQPWPEPTASADIIELFAGDTLVDAVRWNAAWPGVEGVSMSLDPRFVNHVANDDAVAWCDATTPWSAGELGSPGGINTQCD